MRKQRFKEPKLSGHKQKKYLQNIKNVHYFDFWSITDRPTDLGCSLLQGIFTKNLAHILNTSSN